MKIYLILLLACFVFSSCKKDKVEVEPSALINLPADEGGEQTAQPYLSTDAPYGFYIYLPSGYNSNAEARFPLLVFLHGSGEKGNSSTNANTLDLVLRNGPPRLIQKKTWKPPYSTIVVSPQCHENWWDAKKVDALITYVSEHYRINKRRIYLTGLSMGGYGTFSYLTELGNAGQVAAAVPICGGGSNSKVKVCSAIPIWAFHGDADKTVLPQLSIDFVTAFNQQTPTPSIPALLTMYAGVGHDSWSRTYDGTGIGTERKDYSSFNIIVVR